MKIQPEESPPPPPAMASTKSDLRELNTNSKATVAELKSFLRELKGRTPQEMLGVVAASQLIRALATSTLLVGAGILIFTAVPFFLGGGEEATAVTPESKVVTPDAATPPPPKASPATPPPIEAIPGDPLSKLGVGEEKTAPANVNPLENQSDDFLKELE